MCVRDKELLEKGKFIMILYSGILYEGLSVRNMTIL
jgi:hypothetical protein